MEKFMDFRDKLILAPMAGVCDQPFRLLCKEQGCDILYSEMVSAKAIYYKNKNTKPLLAMDEREKPFGLQLFGSDPEIMAEMAKRIESNGYSFIDVNMGCHVPKVVNNGEGSALMKDPVLVGRIVEAMAKAISIPLTIKIRSGFDSEHINAPEIAHIAQESGAAAVAVHGRTRQQYYQGHADWSVIARVKEACIIPIIGNGDINTPQDIIDMRAQTNCDGFMIGRGARGNPWKEEPHYADLSLHAFGGFCPAERRTGPCKTGRRRLAAHRCDGRALCAEYLLRDAGHQVHPPGKRPVL